MELSLSLSLSLSLWLSVMKNISSECVTGSLIQNCCSSRNCSSLEQQKFRVPTPSEMFSKKYRKHLQKKRKKKPSVTAVTSVTSNSRIKLEYKLIGTIFSATLLYGVISMSILLEIKFFFGLASSCVKVPHTGALISVRFCC